MNPLFRDGSIRELENLFLVPFCQALKDGPSTEDWFASFLLVSPQISWNNLLDQVGRKTDTVDGWRMGGWMDRWMVHYLENNVVGDDLKQTNYPKTNLIFKVILTRQHVDVTSRNTAL